MSDHACNIAVSIKWRDNFRLEVVSDVISNVGVEYVGIDVRAKFGVSRSNSYRDIRAAHFVMDDDEKRLTTADAGHDMRQKRNAEFRLKGRIL